MSSPLDHTIAQLNQSLANAKPLTGESMLAAIELIGQLYRSVSPASDAAAHPTDPREALMFAEGAEHAADAALRTQIYAAHLLEASAAHTVAAEELDAVRAGTADLLQPTQRNGQRPTHKNTAELIAAWLGLDYFEARQRVEDAGHVFGQFDDAHRPVGPRFPLLSQRFKHDEAAHPKEVLSAARRIARLSASADGTTDADPDIDLDGVGIEEAISAAFDEADATTRKTFINKTIKDAKQQTEEKDPASGKGFFKRSAKNGLSCYELRVEADEAELLDSFIAQADNPRTEAGQNARSNPSGSSFGTFGQQIPDHPDFVTDEEAAKATYVEPSPATVAQRRLNALMTFLRVNSQRLRKFFGDPSDSPQPSGAGAAADDELLVPTVAPQVVVTMTLAELEGRAQTHGLTLHGHKLNAAQLRRLLARAKIIPMVLGSRSEVLDMGRAVRYHTKAMKLALAVRDRGCIVPGCTSDVEHCEAHHVRSWSKGGATSVHWGAFLCTKHHHDVHAGPLRVIQNNGLPLVLLPAYRDPEQRPQRNQVNFPISAAA